MDISMDLTFRNCPAAPQKVLITTGNNLKLIFTWNCVSKIVIYIRNKSKCMQKKRESVVGNK